MTEATKPTTLAVPTVHLNGTSRDELFNQLQEAIGALEKAHRALGNACPNGRDYYVQKPGSFERAIHQHQERMERLRSVATELETIAENLLGVP